jgi:hypothetical protein
LGNPLYATSLEVEKALPSLSKSALEFDALILDTVESSLKRPSLLSQKVHHPGSSI